MGWPLNLSPFSTDRSWLVCVKLLLVAQVMDSLLIVIIGQQGSNNNTYRLSLLYSTSGLHLHIAVYLCPLASSAHVPNQTIIKKHKPSRTDGSKNGFCLEELVPIVA